VIFVEERKEPKSFTDETSPRQLTRSDRKVSIHGQVIREESLAWFRDLIKLYPGESPEVKSIRILEDFHNQPRDLRNRVWAGMKRVRINLVDSLPYQADYKEVLRDVYKHSHAYELLKENAGHGDRFAKAVLNRMDESVTEDIIKDSTAYRLREMMHPRNARGIWGYGFARHTSNDSVSRYEESVNLEPFKRKTSSMTGKAVKYAAKAASVFAPAIDQINPMMMYYPNTGDNLWNGKTDTRKPLV
jgi:hypothetical protein